jgi:hypothetical protein
MMLFLTCLSLSLLLIVSTIGSAWSSSANNTAVNNTAVNNTAVNYDDTSLQKLLAEFYNWNANVPTEQLPEEGNQCLIKTDPINFLLDPFSKGTVRQTCDIKSGSPLFFPFYGVGVITVVKVSMVFKIIKNSQIAHWMQIEEL